MGGKPEDTFGPAGNADSAFRGHSKKGRAALQIDGADAPSSNDLTRRVIPLCLRCS
jgi:hypothetical protein